MEKGNIYLIPNTIGESNVDDVITNSVLASLRELRHFIVEDIRTARRFLRKAGFTANFDTEVEFFALNKHTHETEIPNFLLPAISGHSMGVLSESGVPCVADPGNVVVEMAQDMGLRVVPFVGPSSIILSLMASGFNGQNFAFIGYLPIKDNERNKKIKEIEQRIMHENQTQIFIEAPYRNKKLFEALLKVCRPDMRLCVARNITEKSEFIKTKSISDWKKSSPDINKRNTIFLLYK